MPRPTATSPEKRFVAAATTSTNASVAAVRDGDDYEEDEDEDGCEEDGEDGKYSDDLSGSSHAKGKRGRPRKHAPKIPLPPLYVFIREAAILFGDSCLIFLRGGDILFWGSSFSMAAILVGGQISYLEADTLFGNFF